MRFPGSQADPTEVSLAILVFADHVVAATIFLNGDITLGALLGVGSNPI